jgi:hypothetical protein
MVEILVSVKSVPVVSDNVAQSISSLPVTVKLIGADDDVAAERASVTVGGVVSGSVVVVVDGATVVVVDGATVVVVVVDGATGDGFTDGATVVVVVADGATVVVVVVDGTTVVVAVVGGATVVGSVVVCGATVVVVDSKGADALPRSPNCIPLAATTVPPANTVKASAKVRKRKRKDSTIRRYEEPCTR